MKKILMLICILLLFSSCKIVKDPSKSEQEDNTINIQRIDGCEYLDNVSYYGHIYT